ncbi:MAG: hypothetical protein ABIV28_07645 [Longimicrobiales bacterium]
MLKRLLVLLVVGGALLAAWQTAHPAPVAAADDMTYSTDTFRGRLERNVGEIASNVLGKHIRASVSKTEHDLQVLRPAIKRSSGADQRRALVVSQKITALDSLSLQSLEALHPILAIRQAMSARGYIGVVKQNLMEERAAR